MKLPTIASSETIISNRMEQHRNEEELERENEEVTEAKLAMDEYGYGNATSASDTNRVALVICIALGFFTILFALSLFLMVNLIVQYGFITFTAIAVLCCIVLPGGWYLLNNVILAQDPKMQRAKTTLLYCWNKAVKEVIQQELHSFQQDLDEHYLLLTNGDADSEMEQQECVTQGPLDQQHDRETQQNRKKSVLFQIIKPFLPGRHRQKHHNQKELSTIKTWRKNRPNRATSSTARANSNYNKSSYEPPPSHSSNVYLHHPCQ